MYLFAVYKLRNAMQYLSKYGSIHLLAGMQCLHTCFLFWVYGLSVETGTEDDFMATL